MPNPVIPVPGIDTPVLKVPKPGFINLTWVDNSSEEGAAPDDVLILAVVNRSGVQATRSVITSAKRSDTNYTAPVTGSIAGEESGNGIVVIDEGNLVWAGFMRVTPKILSAPKTLEVTI